MRHQEKDAASAGRRVEGSARVWPHTGRSRTTRRLALSSLAALLLAGLLSPLPQASTPVQAEEAGAGGMIATTTLEVVKPDNRGWLVLNPGSRRLYQVHDPFQNSPADIYSFDLDSLDPIGQVALDGKYRFLPAGTRSKGSNVTAGADVIHAVDTAGHRSFFPLHDMSAAGTQTNSVLFGSRDSQRLLNGGILVIDDDAFDAGAGSADDVGQVLSPIGLESLAAHGLGGMIYLDEGQAGKLILLMAAPGEGATQQVPGAGLPTSAPDHVLVQIDVGSAHVDWVHPLEPCRGYGLRTSKASGSGTGANQLGFLHTGSSIYVVCEAGVGAAQVVRVPLSGLLGAPSASEADETFVLGRPAMDVLADPSSERLWLRNNSNGEVWYVFDAKVHKWVGALAGPAASQSSAGLDPATGRFYALFGHTGFSQGGFEGKSFPGGFGHADPLSPVPQFSMPEWLQATQEVYEAVDENASVESCEERRSGGGYASSMEEYERRVAEGETPANVQLWLCDSIAYEEEGQYWMMAAYPGEYAIYVDPATTTRPRRVFLRRGPYFGGDSMRDARFLDFPDGRIYTPAEPFYTVIEDRTDTAPPEPGDPDLLTTGFEEEAGVTAAIYHAKGEGYGARSILIEGVQGATISRIPQVGRIVFPASPCERSDRDIVLGLVDGVEIPNRGSTARAYGVDADTGTREDMESPADRCRTRKTVENLALGTGEDQLDPVIDPAAHQVDAVAGEEWARDDYKAECVGDADQVTERDFLGHRVVAAVACRASEEQALGRAAGSLGGALALGAGRGSTQSRVWREEGRGVVVEVVSEVRGVELAELGSIGLVRTEAEVWAGGRKGTAGSSLTRTACGIKFAGVDHPGCASEEQLEQLAAGMSRAMGRRGNVRLRSPDAELARGTPGGYRAQIRRDRLDGLFDQLVYRDFSVAVPGIEIEIIRDSEDSIRRQLVQLAAVGGFANYGIQCLYSESAGGCARPPTLPPFMGPQTTSGVPPAAAGEATPASASTQDQLSADEVLDALPVSRKAAPRVDDSSPSFLRRVVEDMADIFGLFLRSPRDALLVGATFLLISLPAWVVWRRRIIASLVRGDG